MKDNKVYYIPEGSPVAPGLYDVRVQLRNRSRGVITNEDMKQHCLSLPDETENAEILSFDSVIGDERDAGASGGSSPH